MIKLMKYVVMFLCITPLLVVAGEPKELSKRAYEKDLSVLILQINWGRVWRCGQFENAQLQALTFTKAPIEPSGGQVYELKIPSKLFVKNEFVPYVYLVEPGEYILTAFDVRVARSTKEVLHIKGTKENLIKESEPVGGRFDLDPGEIVYIGHFGLDCGAEPFLWRYYIEGREEFERYVAGFRKKYKFLKEESVEFRLFSTQLFGRPYALQNPIVK